MQFILNIFSFYAIRMYFCSGLSRSFLLQNAARSVCTGRAAFRFALLFIPAIGAGLAALFRHGALLVVADELGAVTTWDDATKTVTIQAVK